MSELAAALVEALAELTVIERNRTASIPTKSGGSYSYAYADIGDVIAATRPVLAAQGVVALTPVSGREGGLQVGVTLLHKSGERLDFDPLFFPGGNDPQAVGSTITYYRRYALLAALGIATGEDDDGAAAKAAANRPKKTTRPAEPPRAADGARICPACEQVLTGTPAKDPVTGAWIHPACLEPAS